MLRLDVDVSSKYANRSYRRLKYIISILSILVGLLCLTGFIWTSIEGSINSKLIDECKNDTQTTILCFIRLITTNALRTEWDKYIMVTLLFTYASVFLHIIVESTRTNVSGLLGQMIIQTIFIIVGIGVCFPILFIPSFLYFYKSKNNLHKSPVPIDIFQHIYYIFFSSHELIASIMSIILLISPLGFALISLPFRLLSGVTQRCWVINSHRLIVHCQITLFILSAPLFFITLVSLIMHGSFDSIKQSYVTENTNEINPITFIWSIDYISLFISLILFIISNEYLFHDNINRNRSSKIKQIIGYISFSIIFIITPCLAFPLYIAWQEYHYLIPT
ncbi:unnamed protein product [Adineta steineri]|uniref:Uncharacterized protein n=1 Tax=Adineta steineri TaxID=433720 RepID=A0A815J8L3_9BILA|nr:unnamed protein product [Adineta steineri]CAF1605191.1 unnamed protein product [Adineta steineri]